MGSTTATNVILLVGVGILSGIGAHITGTPIFGFLGLCAFALAGATIIGTLINAFRTGLDQPYQPPAQKPVKRKRAVDPYADVPY